MIRQLLTGAGALVAVALAQSALAVVTVRPTKVASGEQTLTLTATNDFQVPFVRSTVTQIEVEAAPGLRIVRLEPHGPWTGRKAGHGGVWTGGSIRYGQSESFTLAVDVPTDRQELTFVATEHFAVPPRRRERNPLAITVASSDSGTSTAVIAAIAAAGAAALLGLAVYAWRRRRRSLH